MSQIQSPSLTQCKRRTADTKGRTEGVQNTLSLHSELRTSRQALTRLSTGMNIVTPFLLGARWVDVLPSSLQGWHGFRMALDLPTVLVGGELNKIWIVYRYQTMGAARFCLSVRSFPVIISHRRYGRSTSVAGSAWYECGAVHALQKAFRALVSPAN